jgi:hypothetical protein
MPIAPPRWCPVCRAAHRDGCPVRAKQRWKDYDSRRPGRQERGYDEAWRRCRKAFLAASDRREGVGRGWNRSRRRPLAPTCNEAQVSIEGYPKP